MRFSKLLFIFGLFLYSLNSFAVSPQTPKKVLFINSYHEGYVWSDGITEGIKNVLTPKTVDNPPQKQNGRANAVNLKILYLDTKRNTSEAFKQQAARKAKAEIEAFQPDVVIAADDNASKYLIAPYYKDAALPFVFCGVNWDASVYGFPYKNVTGMVEVALVDQILRHLKAHAKGTRIGFIAADTESERKNLENYRKVFGLKFAQTYFPKSFSGWKKDFARAQDEVDMLFILSHAGITGWDDEEAKTFVENNSKIPAGTPNKWEMPYALLGITQVAQEHGVWSARSALKILDGVSPADIPIVTNEQGHLMLNLRLADKLNIAFKPGLLRLAEIIR